MEVVKKAIRTALEKGDANDRAFREKVYRQAFAALERSFQARRDLPEEDMHRRREQMKSAIIDVEREYVAAESNQTQPFPTAPSPTDRPSGQTPEEAAFEPDFVPRIEREERLERRGGTRPDYSPLNEVRTPVAGERKRRRPLAFSLFILVLLAMIMLGLWWTIGGIPTPPTASGDDTASFGENSNAPPRLAESSAEDQDWITIFSPADPTTVEAPAGGSAEALQQGEEAYLQIGAENPGTAIGFDIGQGVLEQLAGKRAVFSLNAQAAEGETEISISCDFGPLGGCGRTRYQVGNTSSEYLFEVELPDQQPSGGGRISITPDVSGQRRMLNVFSLRVREAE